MIFWAFIMPWHVTVVTVGRSLAVLALKYVTLKYTCLKHVECWSEDLNILLNQKTCGWVPNDHENPVFFLIFCWQNGRFLRILLGWGFSGDDFKARSFSDKELGQAVPGTRFFLQPWTAPASVNHPLGFRLLLFVEFSGMKISIVESSVF